MDVYRLVLFLHIVGAVLLFAALGVEVFAGARLRRAGDVGELRGVGKMMEATGPVHGIASLLLLGGGIYLALDQFSLTTSWVLPSFVLTLAFSIIGPAVLAKRGAALVEQVEQAPPGEADAVLSAALNDPRLWSLMHGMAASAVGILWLMTNKPGTVASWVTVIATFAVGALAGRVASQRGDVARESGVAG